MDVDSLLNNFITGARLSATSIPATMGIVLPQTKVDILETIAANKRKTAYPAYNKFHETYNNSVYKDTLLSDYLGLAADFGLIDKDIYKDAIQSLDKFEEKYGPATGELARNWFNFWASGKSKKEVSALYDAMTNAMPTLEKIGNMSIDDMKKSLGDALISNAPTIAGVPGPTYNEVRTGPIASMPVGDVPLWTGQELADLNKTNWNPNHYYDLLKQGTQAAVARDQFGVEQIDQASRALNTRQQASYLDSIRKAKSEAIASGATRGARAANEMLASQETIGNYADAQDKVRQTNYDSMLNSLLADASAKVTAREYFDSLANNRYNEGIQFYANDTDAQGQELLTDAELYNSDLQNRAQAVYANALMDQYYNQAAAQVDVANSGVKGAINEYLEMLDIAAKANGGNVAQAAAELGQVISAGYTNQSNLKDFAKSVNK